MREGFDNDKYIELQAERIRERINQFGGKLYLEFGGKLFDDYHASRVRDVFRLWEYVDPEARVAVSFPIEADIKEFFDTSDITSQQLKQIGIDEPVELIVEDLKRIYDLTR